MDESGLLELATVRKQIRNSGRALILCGKPCQGRQAANQSHLIECVGRNNVLPHIPAALIRAQQIHDRFFGIGEAMAHYLENAPI